jgi:hypothetical protein
MSVANIALLIAHGGNISVGRVPPIACAAIASDDTVGESCSVSVLAGDEVVYVARSARKRKASLHRDVGVNLPTYCTSMARVLMANLPPEELNGYFARVSLKIQSQDHDRLGRATVSVVRHHSYHSLDDVSRWRPVRRPLSLTRSSSVEHGHPR